jgi:hypothetical protein
LKVKFWNGVRFKNEKTRLKNCKIDGFGQKWNNSYFLNKFEVLFFSKRVKVHSKTNLWDVSEQKSYKIAKVKANWPSK